MTLDRAAAYKADRAAIVNVLKDLSDEEWAKPSRCDGWTVKDVVAHMSAACHGTFTPWVVKLLAGKDIEAANDKDTAKRKGWEPAKILSEYENWSKRVVPVMGLVQKPGIRSVPLRVAEVGVYPAALLTSAFVFDHGLHIRYDIGKALGRTVEKRDANRLGVSNEWMLAGLGTMSGDRLDWLDKKIELNLLGPGGGTWTIAQGKKKVEAIVGAAPEAAVTIEAPAEDFSDWGTAREPWREAGVVFKGDEELGTRFLDTMRII